MLAKYYCLVDQGLENYSLLAKSDPLLISVSEALVNTASVICLFVYTLSVAVPCYKAGLHNCERDHLTHNAEAIYYLAFT